MQPNRQIRYAQVSVLFSEPKIPQYPQYRLQYRIELRFQCSSASRKFLNLEEARVFAERDAVSVLFSEPKIPQYTQAVRIVAHTGTFQCSSASRKFLNATYIGSIEVNGNRFSALQRAENSSISR